jgi:hypothetical protein
MTVYNLQAESAGNPSNAYAIKYGPDYDGYYPLPFYQPKLGGNIEGKIDPQTTDDNSATQPLWVVEATADEYRIGDWNDEEFVRFSRDGSMTADSSVTTGSITLPDRFGVINHTGDNGSMVLQTQGNDQLKVGNSGVVFSYFEPTDLSGTSGDSIGDTRLDDGTNTSHGDPDLCVWNGSAWRQVGNNNVFK